MTKKEYDKSLIITNNINKKEYIARNDIKWNLFTNIKYGDIISSKHILSIIIYITYSQLCTNMRKVCRKLNKNESIDDVKKRHKKYVNWIRLLCESIMLFGKSSSWKQVFYHGTNIHPIFKQFNFIKFHQPISMTIYKNGTNKYINKNGVVLEFKCIDSLCWYFDTKNLSTFPEENECIFFHCNMKLIQIHDKLTNKYINTKSFILLEKILNGNNINNKNLTQKKIENDLFNNLNKINDNNNKNYQNKILKNCLNNINKIIINKNEINKKMRHRQLLH